MKRRLLVQVLEKMLTEVQVLKSVHYSRYFVWRLRFSTRKEAHGLLQARRVK